jgi:prepilin-type N-terminal cleavage/methylation domain-containing protein
MDGGRKPAFQVITEEQNVVAKTQMLYHFENTRARQNAFTLIELLMVLAVIGILLAITLGVARSVEQGRNTAAANTQMAALAQALEDYRAHYGDYPWLTNTSETIRRETLYKALIGLQGPRGDQLSPQERLFIEPDRFNRFNSEAEPDAVGAVADYLLDPWGKAYEYHYKTIATPGAWQNPSYVLFSRGASGAAKANDPGPNGRPDYDHVDNRDNIYLNR